MKEYKFEVGKIYTDWVTGKNQIKIVKLTPKRVYFQIVNSPYEFNEHQIHIGVYRHFDNVYIKGELNHKTERFTMNTRMKKIYFGAYFDAKYIIEK